MRGARARTLRINKCNLKSKTKLVSNVGEDTEDSAWDKPIFCSEASRLFWNRSSL